MEITTIEKTTKRLIFEFKGTTHTICNALKEELWNDKDITAASYHVDHPLIGIPKFIIETNGKTAPEKALANAATRLQKKNKEFAAAFAKA